MNRTTVGHIHTKRPRQKIETCKFTLQSFDNNFFDVDLLCVGPHQVLDPLNEEILVHLEEQELAQHRVRFVKALSCTGQATL